MVHLSCRIGEVELTHCRRGNDVDVAVGNFETCHDQAHTTRLKDLTLDLADSFGDQYEMCYFIIPKIDPLIDFSYRHDERMTWSERVDREE